MQFNLSDAAIAVGVTRATLYKHIDKKGITVMRDDDKNPYIEASELIRVYGDKFQPRRLSKEEEGETEKPQPEQEKTLSHNILFETIERERERERKQFEERIEELQNTLEHERKSSKQIQLLLEDKTQETASIRLQSKEQISEMRSAINESKLSEKEKDQIIEKLRNDLDKEKTLKAKILRAYSVEKSKSWFDKLFGKKHIKNDKKRVGQG